MAAKFSMASSMFGAEGQIEASDRMQNAMEELKLKEEKRKKEKEIRMKKLEEAVQQEAQSNFRIKEIYEDQSCDSLSENEEEDDDLMDDPELDRLREIRLKQLKEAYRAKMENLAKGHGQYREITQDEFLGEVTGSEYTVVHFYHRDFERCKVIDKHLFRIAKSHVECKFLKIDAEKSPFFVEKLVIKVLPTIVSFHNGVAWNDRIIGFEGLTTGLTLGKEDEFKTIELAKRLAEIGVIECEEESEQSYS